MNLEQFADNYRLKISRDSCGANIIQGKYSHIFDGYADGRLGVLFVAPTKRHWNNARKKMEAAGLVTKQNGDTEGALSFDPADKAQVRLALKLARVSPRRVATPPSPAQIAAREAFGKRKRSF